MMKLFKLGGRLRRDEEGATAIEYGLLAALIAVAIIATVGAVGGALQDTFQSVAEALPTGEATE